MVTKFLIIGVGGAGCKAADNIDIPNSRKLFVNSDSQALSQMKSDGAKLHLDIGYMTNRPEIHREKALLYKDEIKEYIKAVFEEKE